MRSHTFPFRITDADPLDGQILDWLLRSPNRSDCIREALRVYFFLREHGIPVVPVQQPPAEATATVREAETPAAPPENRADREFFEAMRAGLEDWF